MRFEILPQIEARFRTEASPLLTSFTLPVPNEDLVLRGHVNKPQRSDYFYAVAHPNQRIVLHFTAGNLRSDIQSLTQQNRHVSVANVVARDGNSYQLFPPKFWSGHLGEGIGNQKGTGNPQDKAIIGIEISNYGLLITRDGNLETIYSRLKDPETAKIGPINLYCSESNTSAYKKLTIPFREQAFYPSYTPEQYDSLIILLRYLTRAFNISRQFLPEPKRYQTTDDVLNFKGIVSHINYRSSGKWDIGPAFEWTTVINGVQAAHYMPISSQNKDLEANEFETEHSIDELFSQSKDTLDSEEETTDNEGHNSNDFEEHPILEKQTSTSQNIFALLVGINDYEDKNGNFRIRKLRGCLHDVEVVEHYLIQRTTFDVTLDSNNTGKIKKLTDQQVTRKGIAEAIETHLGLATKNDTILFYYSGHGTQEQADSIWEETDGRLECLVCYNGGATKPSDFLLTDKELRFLIHNLYQKTGAHIITLFDCCHSGDNTRNASLVEATHKDVLERRVTDKAGKAFTARNWSDFLFSDILTSESVAGKKPLEFLPQGVHIQMAACESDQTAVEVAGEGIFTKTLLKTLTDAGGNLSYNTLRSRIRQYMRVGYEQTPRIYAPIEPEKALNSGVFNQPIAPQQTISEAVYNPITGWQLSVGAIHGVDKNSQVTLVDPVNVVNTISVAVSENGVFVDYSQLNDTVNLDRNKVYRAIVTDLMTQELIIELQNHHGNPKEVEQLVRELQKNAKGSFSFGGEKGAKEQKLSIEKDSGATQRADYTFHVRDGEVYLTLPNDPYRPLVRPIPLVTANDQTNILNTLQHISRWHFIKNLQNSIIPNNFPPQALKIELKRLLPDGTVKTVDISAGIANLEYQRVDGKWKGTVQLEITNITGQNLYICAAYLDKEFGCFLRFLPQLVHKLEAGKSIFLGSEGKDSINLKLGRVEQEYNWVETRETIKFLVSTAEFDAEALIFEDLPQPLTTAEINKRGLDKEDNDTRGLNTEVRFSGWMTQRLDLVFKNPVYNQVPLETIKELCDWDETAFFAGGLYYNIKTNELGQPTIGELKEGLKVPEVERGILDDLKLSVANAIESAVRRKRYRNLKKDPNRLRIVAEGDSWFQYPILVQDALDHLYKLYAIRSFAEAGDTLENYLKKREYIETIGKENASIFLISGGGNDILGKEFKSFLRDEPDANDTTLQKYFNINLTKKFDFLDNLYLKMFTEALERYPDLRILVHGYDYVIPLDQDAIDKGKSSWLGQYFIKKGIQPQSEREKCIRFIMDEFNQRLGKVINRVNADFGGRVSYIDVRNTVNRSNWFDEIHPTNEGFQLISNKLIKEIERIEAEKRGH